MTILPSWVLYYSIAIDKYLANLGCLLFTSTIYSGNYCLREELSLFSFSHTWYLGSVASYSSGSHPLPPGDPPLYYMPSQKLTKSNWDSPVFTHHSASRAVKNKAKLSKDMFIVFYQTKWSLAVQVIHGRFSEVHNDKHTAFHQTFQFHALKSHPTLRVIDPFHIRRASLV